MGCNLYVAIAHFQPVDLSSAYSTKPAGPDKRTRDARVAPSHSELSHRMSHHVNLSLCTALRLRTEQEGRRDRRTRAADTSRGRGHGPGSFSVRCPGIRDSTSDVSRRNRLGTQLSAANQSASVNYSNKAKKCLNPIDHIIGDL
ncbi:hypothetical protein FVEG_16630 [Fusarium verticillioides 7600]|uniref:Uncharacterized protein n=1 Tax=Gibberella moniliformis (strain M3125 / FGSC 7600) TaxID=334819 RepID=W7MRT9_GIBM7|nr:hypothetical protein FVEG_16630 [Fusarium verticillioides 7600]EWG50439.1 hypothetical protein FVEG_16630 [Fusarium verticillioides 7600]